MTRKRLADQMEDIDLMALFKERKRGYHSLGKKTVYIEYYTDNIKTHSHTDKRVVYEKTDGSFQCNWFAGGFRDVTKRKDGTFYWRIDIKSIKKHSGDDLIKILKGLS